MDQRGAHLVFDLFVVTESGRANRKAKKKAGKQKTEKGVNEDGKKGGKGRGDEREGRGANINSCSPVHHVL